MSYTVPVFNLFADVWFDGKTPAVDLPDVENLPVQKYLYSRMVYDVQPCELEDYTPPILIRIPFSDLSTWRNAQVFEVPMESGQFYRARFKEIMHEGFSNQYLVAVVVQCTDAGVPLLRDIENAEPCGGASSGAAELEAQVQIAVDAEGEIVATPDIEGAADELLLVELIVIGTGDVL